MTLFSETRDPVELAHRDRLRAWISLAAMAALLVFVAWIVFGASGLWIVLASIAAVLIVEPRLTPDFAMRMLGARPLPPAAVPQLYATVGHLARRARLETMPMLYTAALAGPNAFAVGGSGGSAIGLSRSLADNLTDRELANVLAHEISHVAAGDTGLMRIADLVRRTGGAVATFGLIVVIADVLLRGDTPVPPLFIWALALAPLAMNLLQLALSRAREFAADADAYALTGDAAGLAAGLAKIEKVNLTLMRFLFGRRDSVKIPVFLRTHPTTEERILRLRQLAPEQFRSI